MLTDPYGKSAAAADPFSQSLLPNRRFDICDCIQTIHPKRMSSLKGIVLQIMLLYKENFLSSYTPSGCAVCLFDLTRAGSDVGQVLRRGA